MAPKNPSRLVDNPPSASPSQDHEEEEQNGFEEEEQEYSQVEEDEESEEEGEEEEEENEDTPKTPQKPKKSQSQKHASVTGPEEEEEGFSTDDGNAKSSPTASDFTIKPIVSKNQPPMELKKPSSKRGLIDAGVKKDSSRSSKKSKVAKNYIEEDGEDASKKAGPASGRVWNESDEIAVLEGMIDYQKQKGVDAHADLGGFLEFVKMRFGFEVSRTQLYEKIRRFKKKYFANLEKGESSLSTKPHEKECFELSKKIWGSGNVANGNSANAGAIGYEADNNENVKRRGDTGKTEKSAKAKSDGKGKEKVKGGKMKKENEKKKKKKNDDLQVIEEDEGLKGEDSVVYEKCVKDDDVMVKDDCVENEDVTKDIIDGFSSKYPFLFLSFDMPISPFLSMTESQRKLMVGRICSIDSEKASKLEESWEKLQIQETDFHCRKLELMTEQIRLVSDLLKKR